MIQYHAQVNGKFIQRAYTADHQPSEHSQLFLAYREVKNEAVDLFWKEIPEVELWRGLQLLLMRVIILQAAQQAWQTSRKPFQLRSIHIHNLRDVDTSGSWCCKHNSWTIVGHQMLQILLLLSFTPSKHRLPGFSQNLDIELRTSFLEGAAKLFKPWRTVNRRASATTRVTCRPLKGMPKTSSRGYTFNGRVASQPCWTRQRYYGWVLCQGTTSVLSGSCDRSHS